MLYIYFSYKHIYIVMHIYIYTYVQTHTHVYIYIYTYCLPICPDIIDRRMKGIFRLSNGNVRLASPHRAGGPRRRPKGLQ